MTTEARSRYRRAVEWLARCLEFGAGAHFGEDTSEAQVAMAEAFVGLDERDRAWEMARAARDAAQRAGNQLDLASALAVMAPSSGSRATGRRLRRALWTLPLVSTRSATLRVP